MYWPCSWVRDSYIDVRVCDYTQCPPLVQGLGFITESSLCSFYLPMLLFFLFFWLNLWGFTFFQSRDLYFLKKLLNLKGDDGFRMNEVLVSLWYIMGLWPLVYNMLLLPTGRRYFPLIYIYIYIYLSNISNMFLSSDFKPLINLYLLVVLWKFIVLRIEHD